MATKNYIAPGERLKQLKLRKDKYFSPWRLKHKKIPPPANECLFKLSQGTNSNFIFFNKRNTHQTKSLNQKNKPLRKLHLLILKHQLGQCVLIDNEIKMDILRHYKDKTLIGVNAPPHTRITRENLETKEFSNQDD